MKRRNGRTKRPAAGQLVSTNRSLRADSAELDDEKTAETSVLVKEPRPSANRGAKGAPIAPLNQCVPWLDSLVNFLRQPFVCGLGLVLLTVLAYQPVWHAGFIWDDDVYVIRNKLLTAPDGLGRIWFSQDSPSQYFPLVYTMFRFEYALWGLSPTGYHWVNLVLHAANGLLVWRLLRRLEIPWAWLGAALFTLHPVQVESVAWITERKNVSSMFFALLCLLAWLQFLEGHSRIDTGMKAGVDASGRSPEANQILKSWAFYPLALSFYALALFSKTTACTLPAALVLVLWLKKRPLTLWRWAQIAPFVFMGLGMGLVTMWWERHHIGTHGSEFAIPLMDRLLIASRGVWFYLAKLVWPFQLAFSYPRWTVNASNPLDYIWILLGGALGLLVWYARRSFGRGPETALVFFVATLSPTLGFIMLFTFRYTFVADHYQYVACLGPLALAAAGLAWIGKPRSSTPNSNLVETPSSASLLLPRMAGIIGTVLVLGLAALTWSQARSYKDLETLWRDTVRKNPDSWMARYNLSRDLLHRGKIDEALAEYREAIKSGPDQVNGLVSLGNALFAKGQHDQAMDCYRRALQLNPDCPEAHVNLAVILASRGQLDEAIEHDRQAVKVNPMLLNGHVNLAVALASKGQYAEALEHYRKAIEINPDQPMTHINLAIALEGLGQTNEARLHYQAAAASVNAHAAGLVQQGRLDEAALQYREAIRLIPDNAEGHYGYGLLLVRQGKRAEARSEFAEAIRMRPGYPEAQRALSDLQ